MERREYGENVTLETRAEAHETVDKQRRYMQIIECLNEGPGTAKEIAVVMCRRGYIPTSERNFTAPRLTEMSKDGRVEPIGRKKCTYTGKTVAVYALRNVKKMTRSRLKATIRSADSSCNNQSVD